MTRNMRLVQAAASFALTGTGGSCSAVVDLVSVLKGLSIVCWAIPSGPLLVRPYPYIGERYMGNKYHVLHRHLSRLSRLSRRDDLELGVAVISIHRAAEKGYLLGNWAAGVWGSQKLVRGLALISALGARPHTLASPSRAQVHATTASRR